MAASATGLPPYVEPCAPVPQSMTSARAIIAPIGIPEAIPLAVRRMSGSTPKCSIAHILPVRPAPDWTSSAMSRIPCRSQISRSRGQERRVGDDVAALALDRLDDHGGELVGRHQAPKDALLELVEAGAAEGTW